MKHLLLLLVFFQLTFAALACERYDRKSYRHWVDEDRDCQNARHEVLLEESQGGVSFKTSKGCRVIAGNWLDPYSGRMITDASQLDIDHLVPLKEAHESGGYAWDAQTRQAYANDLRDPNHLIAVDRSLNRQKGARDPAEWLPPNPNYLVAYAQAWVDVKRKWNLTADAKEIAALRQLLGSQAELPRQAPEMNCSGQADTVVPKLPAAGVTVTCGSKRYCKEMTSCSEARAFLTQCGLSRLDRDKDGIPCESLCR